MYRPHQTHPGPIQREILGRLGFRDLLGQEIHFLRLRLGMSLSQVSIDHHGGPSAILVPQPGPYSWNVHARLNAARGKYMPQVVVGEVDEMEVFARMS